MGLPLHLLTLDRAIYRGATAAALVPHPLCLAPAADILHTTY